MLNDKKNIENVDKEWEKLKMEAKPDYIPPTIEICFWLIGIFLIFMVVSCFY